MWGQVFTITVCGSDVSQAANWDPAPRERWISYEQWQIEERHRLAIERAEREAAIAADTLRGWRELVHAKSGAEPEPGPPLELAAPMLTAAPPRSRPRGARLGIRNYSRR